MDPPIEPPVGPAELRKCSRCKKDLALSAFTTRVVGGAAVVNRGCITCTEKHHRSSNARRDAEVAAKRKADAAAKAVEVAGRETKKCKDCCKVLVVEECFGLNNEGKPLLRCRDCMVKHNEKKCMRRFFDKGVASDKAISSAATQLLSMRPTCSRRGGQV
tara:strand:- start:165 stop:644 length:480 start_codon:yes stop_codon:yes gene_type:complete